MGHQHISIKLSSVAILKNQNTCTKANLQLQRSHMINMKGTRKLETEAVKYEAQLYHTNSLHVLKLKTEGLQLILNMTE